MVSLRKLAEGKPCIVCSRNDGSTVLHHIRLPGNCGIGQKPDDFPWAIRCCSECHDHFHNEGRADHKLMLMSLGRQMRAYRDEGVIQVHV